MRERHPLVLIPGSLCDGSMWDAQVEALADLADSRVIGISGYDSVVAMATHVLETAHARSFALAGFSLGGYVALEVVRRSPGRVTHLALIDTSAAPDHPDTRRQRETNLAAFAADPDPILQAFAELTQGPVTPGAVADRVLRSMREGSRDYAAQQRAMSTRPDARPHLGSISCPTLVLVGERDAATPPARSRELAAAIAGAELVEIAGAGHMTTLEAPGEVAEAMRRWLGQSSAPSASAMPAALMYGRV